MNSNCGFIVMLDDYVLSRLNSLQKQKDLASKELKNIELQETDILKQITELQNIDNVSLEIFSPRNKEDNINIKTKTLKKQESDFISREKELKQIIEKLSDDIEKYRSVLKQESSISYDSGESSTVKQKEFHCEDAEVILGRIEESISLIDQDPDQAKNILRNLIYYLKALITEMQS